MMVLAKNGTTDPEYVFPRVKSGAEATSFFETVCADSTGLPLLFIVYGSGGRVTLAVEDGGNGKNRRFLARGVPGRGRRGAPPGEARA